MVKSFSDITAVETFLSSAESHFTPSESKLEQTKSEAMSTEVTWVDVD